MRLVLVTTLALALAAPAAAAPARYCELLKDDGRELPAEQYAPGSASDVTILSADVANDTRALTAVVRVRALPDVPSQGVNGAEYQFAFSATPEHHYVLVARLGADRVFEAYRHLMPAYGAYEMPEDPVWMDEHTFLGNATGVVDTVADEVRVTVPLSMLGFRGGFPRGTRLNYLAASAGRTHGDVSRPGPVPPFFLLYHQDALTGGRHLHYPAGAPSCVRVGR